MFTGPLLRLGALPAATGKELKEQDGDILPADSEESLLQLGKN
jgi:hypothetical protein